MRPISICVAILILKTVGTGQQRILKNFLSDHYTTHYGIIGLYFSEDEGGNTVTVDLWRYVNMLTTFLTPELDQHGIALGAT